MGDGKVLYMRLDWVGAWEMWLSRGGHVMYIMVRDRGLRRQAWGCCIEEEYVACRMTDWGEGGCAGSCHLVCIGYVADVYKSGA